MSQIWIHQRHKETFVMRSVSRLGNLFYLIYELLLSSPCFLSWIRGDRSEKWDEENSCCMHWGCDTHENGWDLCQTPWGGSLEHKAWVWFVFHCYAELKPTAQAQKSSLFLGEVALLPKPHCSRFWPREEEKLAKRAPEAELVEEGAGKTSQDEPAVGFPLDSCSWEPRIPSLRCQQHPGPWINPIAQGLSPASKGGMEPFMKIWKGNTQWRGLGTINRSGTGIFRLYFTI